MVQFLREDLLFRSTKSVYPDETWPLPKRLCKLKLKCRQKDVATCLPAFGKLEGRKDVDCLWLDFEHLLDGNIRQLLDNLFQKRDRAWKIRVSFRFPFQEHVETSRLRSALAILKTARYVDVWPTDTSGQHDPQLDVLGNLPHFENLKCLNLESWIIDQNDVKTVLDNPSIPSTSFSVPSPNLPLRGPMFPSHTARYIDSIRLKLIEVSSETASQWARKVIGLPALKNLTVVMCPTSSSVMHEEALSIVLSWLENPQCPITSLTFFFLRNEYLPMIVATIPKIPLLTCLSVHCYGTCDWCLDDILFAIASSPTVNCICFVDFHFGKNEEISERLLRFQLECRPRRMLIGVGDEHHDVNLISLTYQTVEDFERTTEKGPLPKSAWPFYLSLLGDRLIGKSRIVREVVLDSIHNGLQHLLPGYACDWELKFVFVVRPPVERTNVSEFVRTWKKSQKNGMGYRQLISHPILPKVAHYEGING